MCELMGISCNKEVTATFSFNLLTSHSPYNPHGWGLAFYPDESVQIFKEPVRADKSDLAKFISIYTKIKSTIFISHIRQKSKGKEVFKNTHPFSREWNGRSYVFAHNGTVPTIHPLGSSPKGVFQPVGETDSEMIFCNLMDLISRHNLDLGNEADLSLMEDHLRGLNRIRGAKINCLLSDGKRLLCYRDSHSHKNLYLLQRKPGDLVEGQHLEDDELSVLLHVKKAQDEKACIVATEPLTCENWTGLAPGTITVLEKGEVVYPSPMDLEEVSVIQAEVYDSPSWAEGRQGFPDVVGIPEKLRKRLEIDLGGSASLVHGEKALELRVYPSDKRLVNVDSPSAADNRECHVWLPPQARKKLGIRPMKNRIGKASFKRKYDYVGITKTCS
jgi:predicted glutamine amidotransferase